MDYESKVKEWFSKHGYEINKIPESNEQSPDFLITDETSKYLLELKTKFPSEDEIDERRQILSSGEIHNIDEIITFQKGLSKIISNAKNQLKNYSRGENILRLVWLLSAGHLSEPRLDQLKQHCMVQHIFTQLNGMVIAIFSTTVISSNIEMY